MRQFNTTGTCFPQLHYMVDISRQVNYAADMVKDNKYFCINRGRQFGKTTTLSILQEKLEKDGYAVFSMSFEGLSDSDFESLDSVCAMFFKMMKEQIEDEYLDYYHLDEGYMLSFCFNKNKIPGPEDVTFGSKILHEVIV